MKRTRFLALLCAIILGAAALALAQKRTQHNIDVQRDRACARTTARHNHMMMHDQMMVDLQVGKRGDLKIDQPTIIGGVTLQPGDYEVQHLSSPAGHYLEITRVSWKEVWTNEAGYSSSDTQFVREPFVRVNCELRPLNAKVNRTALMVSADRTINGLEIRGETVEHIF